MAKGSRQQGVVAHYDTERGQGEIRTERGDLLPVHRSALQQDTLGGLHSGDIVEFRVGRNRFGRTAALDVHRIGWEDEPDDDGPGEWTF